MLVSAVLLPELFVASCFDDPSHRLNVEILLRGIHTNGIILSDNQERLYNEILDLVERLATHGKGKSTHILFEELLKKHRNKIIRFVKSDCPSHTNQSSVEIALCVANHCQPHILVTDANNQAHISSQTISNVQVLSIHHYFDTFDHVRDSYAVSQQAFDQIGSDRFGELIVMATRFSRWLRFYDKQIGKGTSLSRFRVGIARVLELWLSNAHFPKDQLAVDVYTTVDESSFKTYEPSVARSRVVADLIDQLQNNFGIKINLSIKRDPDSICHARHLQTQSQAILFERGFDIFEDDGSLCRGFMSIGGDFVPHLNEFRKLKDY